jgi:hypothetical protein
MMGSQSIADFQWRKQRNPLENNFMNRVPRELERYFTHKINLRCFKQRNTVLFNISKNLIIINIVPKVCATIISYFNDRTRFKTQECDVLVLYLTHSEWNSSLKQNKALLSNKFISFTWL